MVALLIFAGKSTIRDVVREEIGELQRTGDIFFPKRWADASLNSYQSPQAAAIVRNFIKGLPPDYPERLRWVIEASADSLFRVTDRAHLAPALVLTNPDEVNAKGSMADQ